MKHKKAVYAAIFNTKIRKKDEFAICEKGVFYNKLSLKKHLFKIYSLPLHHA